MPQNGGMGVRWSSDYHKVTWEIPLIYGDEMMKDWLLLVLYLLTLITGFLWRDTQNMIIKGIYLVLFFIASCTNLYIANQTLKEREKPEDEETDVR